MEARVIVCLFVVVIVSGNEAPVGSLCRSNERLLMCGCPRTCRDPAPDCAAVCRPGCYCEPGQIRNDDGLCVKLADCPPILSAYKQDTSEPRPNHGKCGDLEEYRYCEPCNKTCANPNPICPAQCSRGCFCKEGLLRDQDGNCVLPEKCFKSKPEPIGAMVHDSQPSHHDPSVEDCAPEEEYFSCGWCEPTCSEPTPSCPTKVCNRGCQCRPPLLRQYSGECVDPKDCYPQQCQDINEEFVCLYGCELRCDTQECVQPRYCVFGCYCKPGLLRDNNGLCVLKDKCSNSTDAVGVQNNMLILII